MHIRNAGIRPTSSLEEFFGEDVGLLEHTSNIELAKQLRNASIVQSPTDGAQYADEELDGVHSHAGLALSPHLLPRSGHTWCRAKFHLSIL